jgi:DNA-binding winged helix-turn-helix (wHTH) protein/TolB-like protein
LRYLLEREGVVAIVLSWRPDPRNRRPAETAASMEQVDLARSAGFPIGPIVVQPSILQIEAGATSTTIEPRVMQVLVVLASSPFTVISRDQLIDSCWGGRIVGEDAINRCIAKLRRLGADFQAFEIETIPRVGYRLVPSSTPSAPAEKPTPRSRALMIAVTAVLIAVLAVGALSYWRNTAEPHQPKIAVLPFTALNADPEVRDFADSIVATVGNALVQTGARLPDGNIRTVDDARRSGAALIISGTVRRDGSAYRVTARVDSARQQTTLLTNEFDAESSDAPAVPGRVAAWLIPSVRMWASFLPVESDPAVTDEIMRIFLTRAGEDKLRAWNLSRSLAAAHAGSGSAQLVFALLTSDVLELMTADQRRAQIPIARQAARNAARLLPDPARPLAVLQCHFTAPGWHVLTSACDQRTRAAIAADPAVPLLPFLFAAQLTDTGRFVEAARFADMDLSQNPLGPGQLALRIFDTRMSDSGDLDDALPQLEARMARYLGPDAIGGIEFDTDVANGDFARAQALLDNPRLGIEGRDPTDTARTVLRAVQSKNASQIGAMRNGCNPPSLDWGGDDPAFETCLVGLAAVGDLDSAFALARRAYRDVECCSAAVQEQQWLATGGSYYPRSPLFGKAMAAFRADPRFVEIARRTGLLAYWKSEHPPDFCSFERAPICALLH